MLPEEAMAEQERIVKHFNLGWWYGVECKRCCRVFPKAMTTGTNDPNDFYYMCPVCGKRTRPVSMPWLARDEWNAGRTIGDGQISLF